jgi:type II secretory pathway pseudopilin PulG
MAAALRSGSRRGRQCGRGYTYLGLLFLLALGSAAWAGLGEVAATAAQRERERELLFRGEEIRRAIEAYARTTPSGHDRWPRSLQDLLVDKRHGKPRHHLRRVYPDPFTGRADWVLMPAPGVEPGFQGVRSGTRVKPLMAEQAAGQGSRNCVCDWKFEARL